MDPQRSDNSYLPCRFVGARPSAAVAGFQGLDIGDSKFGEKLFSAIAKRLNVAKLPKISFPEFEAEIRKASAATQSSSEVGDDASQIAPTDDASLAEAHYKILKTLAAHKDAGHGAMDEPQLAAALGTKRTLLSLKIKPLVSARLVHTIIFGWVGRLATPSQSVELLFWSARGYSNEARSNPPLNADAQQAGLRPLTAARRLAATLERIVAR